MDVKRALEEFLLEEDKTKSLQLSDNGTANNSGDDDLIGNAKPSYWEAYKCIQLENDSIGCLDLDNNEEANSVRLAKSLQNNRSVISLSLGDSAS